MMIIRYSVEDICHTKVLHSSNIWVLIAVNSVERDIGDERKNEERIKEKLRVCRKGERD